VRAETRHQLKQDRFTQATIGVAEATAHWTVEHKSKLIAGGAAVAILIAIVAGGWYYLSQQDAKASVELGAATRILSTQLRPAGTPAQPEFPTYESAKERATDARRHFQAIVDQYPHTRSADIARYFLGLTSATLGDNASAERELQSVAALHNEDLASLAKMALASVYRDAGRNKDAIALYQQLINKPTVAVGKTAAELELASTYLAEQQPAEAKRIYEQVQKENPATEASQLAAQKLQDLK